jgi:hypothetical protein
MVWLIFIPRLTALLAVMFAASAAAASPREAKTVRLQFAFFHFKNERVRVIVDGKTAFDQTVTVAPDDARYGLAAAAQIGLAPCATIVVATKRQRIAQHLCRTAATKSIVIDGGPPLTIVAKDQYQGLD